MRKYVDQIDEAINVQNMMLNDSKLIDRINLAAEKCVSSIKSGNKILLAETEEVLLTHNILR